jgi:DNA-binding GntR family transcriptional regulator
MNGLSTFHCYCCELFPDLARGVCIVYSFAMASNTSYDESYAMLRAQILDGSLRPGSRLQQDDIARQFGLSRVPLREAIRKLEGERLVVVVPRRGVTVPDLSDEDLTDIYLIRIQLEPLAFRRAVEAGTAEQIAVLVTKTEKLAELLGNPGDFFQAHDEVVRATLAMSPGDVFADIVSMVRERSQYLRYSYSQLPGQTEKLLKRRHTVMDAVVARRADLVEQLTRIDLIEGRDALLTWRRQQRTSAR